MAGSVQRLPSNSGGDHLPPIELYKVAVEEYRFQATFNWTRTQYLLAFNAGILTAAVALSTRKGHGAALVFLLGMGTAVLSSFAVRTQHDYYRAARDRMRRLEDSFGVPQEARTDTTTSLGGRRRLVSVAQVVYLLLAAVFLADGVGALAILAR